MSSLAKSPPTATLVSDRSTSLKLSRTPYFPAEGPEKVPDKKGLVPYRLLTEGFLKKAQSFPHTAPQLSVLYVP
ncbi:MAG: hypothetical protein Q9N34_01030 [Aquificota bacterium]|nr:hypothetical protein [Aquificota bacterium]